MDSPPQYALSECHADQHSPSRYKLSIKSRLFGRSRGLPTGEQQTLSEDATFFMWAATGTYGISVTARNEAVSQTSNLAQAPFGCNIFYEGGDWNIRDLRYNPQ
jgi:hypothetical protein